MRLGYEEELPAPVFKPAAVSGQPGHAGGLSGREGQPDVTPGSGAAQEV